MMYNLPDGFKKTEVGVIPSDWDVKRLGDIASIRRGASPRPIKDPKWFADNGRGWIRISDVTNSKTYLNETTQYLSEAGARNSVAVDKGDLVMSICATIGMPIIINIPACIHDGFVLFKNYENELDTFFLYYFLESKTELLSGKGQPGTQKNLNISIVSDIQIPLPHTKAEQIVIATALNDTDALITRLEKLITKKRNIKQGAMQELLKPKEGWEVKKLGEVATLKARIGWQGLTTAEYRKSGDYFLITGTEFKNGFIDWENCFYVEEERYKQDKNIQTKEHDVLVTKDGTIGKVALIKSVPKPATLNSGVFVIRPINNSFEPEFFYYLLLSEIFLKFLSQLSAGSTINHLYQKDFVSFQFLTPKTIEEQNRIAQILSDMDAEIEAMEKKLEKYNMMRQGMMQNLLTGKIRLI